MPSVTFHAVCIASNRRKDGTIPVKIRVTFKAVSRRLPTTLIARPGDLTRSLAIKSPDINRRANELIARMQAALTDLSPFDLEAMDVDNVVAHIRARMTEQTFALDFFAWADGYLAGKKDTTRRAYTMALNALERFLGRRSLDINALTRSLLLDFVAFIDDEPKMHYDPRSGEWVKTKKDKGVGASSRHLMKLEHIFNAAKLKYNDDDRVLIPRDPFNGIPRNYGEPEGEQPLPLELMQRLAVLEVSGVERVALDAFLLSFATMGANMADLYAAPRDAVRKKDTADSALEWVYCRKKITSRKAEMRVDLLPEVSQIVGRLKGRGEWWLNALHRIAGNTNLCTAKVNAALGRIAARLGVGPFKFYSARKSWGTYARNICKVELATVDEALAHRTKFPLADVYIAKSWTHLNEANRQVVALLRWDGRVNAQQEKQVYKTKNEVGVLG